MKLALKKKVMVTGGLLPIWSTTALSPGETITSEKYAQKIDEMHQKLQPCNWQKSPILHQVWLFNFWSIGLWRANWAIKFCLICHIRPTSRPLTTISSSILTTFCRENAFQEFVESQSTDFYATEINSLLNGKNVLIVRVPILINKDLFELSYDLKFTVRNYKYFCTNLNVKHAIKHFTHFSLHVGNQCFTLVFSCVPQ